MPDPPLLLHQIFLAAAARHPDAIALEVPPRDGGHGRRQVSYRELGAQADALAAALAPCAAPDALLAVLLPRHDPALYAAQLGTLQAGAAFTCLDPNFPDVHLAEVLAGSAAVLTDAAGQARLANLGPAVPPVLRTDLAGAPPAAGGASRAAVTERDLAYVIYTSGTTGQPKGVMVEHGAIVNLVRADMEYFGLDARARVAQCSSPAYDSSLEETWLALAVGATLVLLDDATIRLGPDLVPWLQRERISVFCPPPTLLRATGCADPEQELPGLQLLYVGGEALAQDLAARWARGRWLENGYGPTECAVTSVRTRIQPGEAVTIGVPVAHCQAWVLDEQGGEVEAGAAGELCLGGACLARGYRGDAALTAAKFPQHPRLGRMYRSGDRVRRRPDGLLEYLGRLDAQVKLRGYRIELEAVEAALAACPGVRTAGCRVQGEGALQLLAAQVVAADPEAPPAPADLRQALRQRLPAYMVPSRIGVLAALPTTAGGKLDRARLPELAAPSAGGSAAAAAALAPRNPQERTAAEAFALALHRPGAVGVDDDFFLDLGGDSLSAVDCIVRLRGLGWAATVRDLYETRTASGLATRELAAAAPPAAAAAAPPRAAGPRPGARPLLCTLGQAGTLGLGLMAASAAAYAAAFLLLPRLLGQWPLWQALLALLLAAEAGLLLYLPVSLALAALLKRALIGVYRPRRVPVWSGFYLRHWIVTRAARAVPWGLVQGTALQAGALRTLGARVGRRVYIHRGVDLSRGGWDLLTLGDGATVGCEAALRLADLDDGQLVVGAVTVGAHATLDTRAGMDPDSRLGPHAYLGPLSWLRTGAAVPAGERWEGVPASCAGPAPAAPALTCPGELGPGMHAALVLAWRSLSRLAMGLPWLALALVTPAPLAARLMEWLQAPRFHGVDILLAAVLAAAGVVAGLVLRAAAARGLGRGGARVVSAWSVASIRVNAALGQVEAAGRWLSGTLVWPLWLRAAGMRLGRGCEISTIIDVMPALVAIGAESFFADGIYLGGPRRHRGTVALAATSLGPGTFLGNHAVIPAGHAWPAGLFVGVATVAAAGRARPHSAWFGQPPIELPRKVEAIDRRLTHEPGPLRFATRVFWEAARLALPALPLVLTAAWGAALYGASARWGDAFAAFAAAPLLALGAGAACAGAIILLKWVLLGRVRPGQHYFWSCWCGRWDLLYMAWQYWGAAVLLPLEGTLLLNHFLRATGVRLGRRVALGPGFAQVVDPDLLRFDDDATVSAHMQAHTFEDRILKLDYIHIGAAASAGDEAVILYGTAIGPGAALAPHSVLMKHDLLPPGARFAGAPARPGESQPAAASATA